MERRLCWVLLAAALALPAAGASTEAGGCAVYTYPATPVADHYAYGTEVWQEANGLPGLQRVVSPCEDRDPLPPDRCITHENNDALIACALAFASSTAP